MVQRPEINVRQGFLFSILNVLDACDYIYINESDNFLNSYRSVVGKYFNGNNYLGTGAKIMAQTKTLNIYAEIRQYWAMDKNFASNTFTQNPTLIVGAFYNLNFYTRKSKLIQDNQKYR